MSEFDLSAHPVAALPPARLAPSGWIELAPLGMLLVDLLRPSILVELGVHQGVSYCAFCQAVAALGLPTQCWAIDTWIGDEHTSPYGSEVLDDLRAWHDPRYGAFSTLLPMTFGMATARFPLGSIDLLHLDGAHAYRSVREDFAAWLPRMSRRGVMLFHDIAVRHSGFGVHRFWQEVREAYPHFQVGYGHGLGVLAVGAEIPAGLQPLLSLATEQQRVLEAELYALGQRAALALNPALPDAAARLARQPAAERTQQVAFPLRSTAARLRALVINPGRGHPGDAEGERLAEALTTLGIAADVAALGQTPAATYDWCFVNNPHAAAASTGDLADGIQQLTALRQRCGHCYAVITADVSTPRFPPVLATAQRAGLDDLLDLGLHPQGPVSDVPLRFLCNGLTVREKREVMQQVSNRASRRPIPWVMVGMQTPARARLAADLVQHVAPDGFVYLPLDNPPAAPRRDLDAATLARILAHSQYAFWCSQHNPFYLESQRFRQALLAGAAPVKVLPSTAPVSSDLPLAAAFVVQERLPDQAALTPAAVLHERVAAAYCALPGLEKSLAALLGLPVLMEVEYGG
jgi:hypothetical protein